MKKKSPSKKQDKYFKKTKSETILNNDDKIILYSTDDFYNRIVIGDDCFICGEEKASKKFNDEHILPDWVLTKYKLHNKTITFPNKVKYQYGKYTVPCCVECNTKLGENLEKPISKLFKLSYSEFCKEITKDKEKIFLIYKWLLLIFFKTHIKDKEFRWYLDKRKGAEKISDNYDWQEMHHIHCMIRTDFTNAIVATNTIGSIFILPAIQHSTIEPFDFTDNEAGKSILLRLDGICVICVLNDSCGSYSLFQNDIVKIKGALSPFQLREIFSHLVYINLNLKTRPKFYSKFSTNGKYNISADVPKNAELVKEEDRILSLGEILSYYIQDMLDPKVIDQILPEVKKGRYTYLVNEKGEFLDYSINLK